jgi:hypothetical protein
MLPEGYKYLKDKVKAVPLHNSQSLCGIAQAAAPIVVEGGSAPDIESSDPHSLL